MEKNYAKCDILIYIPNLIGYTRILLGLSPVFLPCRYFYLSIVCYCISQLMDALDGHYARLYNQSTKFGAMLDMMTDRCCTLALILTCLTLRSSLYYLTVIYLIGDIAGHWLYMMASHMYGKASHKDNSKDMWFVLNMYYSNKIILFASHGCNELFWLLMYLQGCIISKNIHQDILWYTQILTFFVLPLTIFKNITNYVQLLYGCKLLLEMDISEINKQFK